MDKSTDGVVVESGRSETAGGFGGGDGAGGVVAFTIQLGRNSAAEKLNALLICNYDTTPPSYPRKMFVFCPFDAADVAEPQPGESTKVAA